MRSLGRTLLAIVGATTAVACASPSPPPPKMAHAVSAIVLVNHCASLGAADAKLAEKAMNQLVEGCGSFAGGTARFTATLLPGGAIQFESRADASAAIPVCALSHPLTHGVHLKKSCSLDVALEESSMTLPTATVDGGR